MTEVLGMDLRVVVRAGVDGEGEDGDEEDEVAMVMW